MKKSPSIRAIFERCSEGNYTKDAQLYQYILKYCTKDGTLENDIVIRPWDLTDWLVDHYPEWRNLYQGSHLKKYSKIQYNLPRVKRKLDDLKSLFLLEEKTGKAQKVDTDIIIYYYTKSGNFLAWLVETDDTNLDKKATAIQKVYDILISHLSDKDTSRSVFLSELFGRCRQEGVFIDAIFFLTSFEQARPMYNELALIESFLDVRRTLYWIFTYPELFIETLNSLNEEMKKALFFQFKIEIEQYYDIYFSTKEWEINRYHNISNYSSVTIPGFCNRCKSKVSFQYDLLKYFHSIYEMKRPYPSGIIMTDCVKCGKEYSLSGRVMLFSWDALVQG